MEDAFGFTETVDQLTAITEVKADMEKPVPMDRVICGDVGYGKTEIAVRAAFKAVQDGKQVAVLVPTTLLADQHLQTFTERMAGFPVTVKGLSRFTDPAESRAVLEGMKDGSVDIVIGTHRLLQTGVTWKDLGLVVVDEEQRFGVEHKEHIKSMRTHVDVLTMSATPIPRTLEMSLAGIREMSTILTPPEERYPVLDLRGPARRQAGRGGAAPRAAARRAGVLHPQPGAHHRRRRGQGAGRWCRRPAWSSRTGRCPRSVLERTVEGFWNREYDILVCTTIVETGLDISNANTLIVERADTFGLSQLHQLRGRVGRSRERGYAYFLYPPEVPLTETAYDRLATIAQNNELGAGMAVAMKDLEIRGAGNVLGRRAVRARRRSGVRPLRAPGRRGRGGLPSGGRRQDHCRRCRNRRTCASTCRSTLTCRPTTSAATGCGWRPTAGWRRPPTTRVSPRWSTNSSTATASCPNRRSGWSRWRGCGCCAASTGSPRSARPRSRRCGISPLTLLDSQQLRLKRLYPGATLPRHHLDRLNADPAVGQWDGCAADPRSRTAAGGGGFAPCAGWETAGQMLI